MNECLGISWGREDVPRHQYWEKMALESESECDRPVEVVGGRLCMKTGCTDSITKG